MTRGRAADVARTFLILGLIGFGGPAAHIALMRRRLVARERWVSDEQFLDLMAAANLVPGPNSTELALHLGRVRAGAWGLVAAGTLFILPAALLSLLLAALYVDARDAPLLNGLLYVVRPVMLAVVVDAFVVLGRRALRTPVTVAICAAAALGAIAGVHELVLLALAAVAGAASRAAGIRAVEPVSLAVLGAVMLKIGATLYGSGYLLLAYLRGDLVERLHWLTDAQLLDLVAIGQATPGPVLSTATAVGYVLAGIPGAAVATLAIFLPAFIFVAASGPLVALLRRHATARAAMDGVVAASLALVLVVAAELAREAVVDVPTAVLAVAAFAVLRLRG